MIPEKFMWHLMTGLGIEVGCALVILAVTYLDTMHRGTKMKDTASPRTRLTSTRLIVAAIYLLDILMAFILAGNSTYQKWRLGSYLRALLFILFHDNTLQIWKLHIGMLPHLFEIGVLIVSFCGFYAVLGMNVFEKGKEGSDHFETFNSSMWTLIVLITTSNTPQVFVESFESNRATILYFISFIIFGAFGLLYILMATVFSQFQLRLEDSAKFNKEARQKSVHEAYLAITAPAIDPNGPPPMKVDSSTTMALLQQFSLNVNAISPQLQADLVDQFLNSPNGHGSLIAGANVAKVDDKYAESSEAGDEAVLSEAEFGHFFDELELRMGQPQSWPHEVGGRIAGFCKRLLSGFVLGSRKRPLFEVAVDVLIFSNLVIFAVEGPGCSTFHDKGKSCTLDIIELFLSVVFFVELVVKLTGLGLRNYWDSLTNRLDLVATLTSTVLVVLYWAQISSYDNSSTLELGVALRLTRSFRFLGYAPTFDLMAGVINKIGANVKGLAGFMLTLFMVWATLGQQLLGGKICVEDLNTDTDFTCPQDEKIGHTEYIKDHYYTCNFNDPLLSLVTLFVIMVGNDWGVIVDAYTDATTKFMRIYFVFWYIAVVFIALNTTLSFIIDTYITEQRRFLARQTSLALDPLHVLRARNGSVSEQEGGRSNTGAKPESTDQAALI